MSLDKDTQLDLALNPSVSEEITVTAAQPTIDVKSSDVQVNYSSEQIENLPLARTYKGLFQLAPGVSENGRLAPNAGAARMDNTYLIDGINVTNPHYGDILPNVTDLDIAEVSIKRGGISAEYGRAAGMVVNAVTKSGTNNFRGQARLEYQPDNFVSDSKISTLQNTRERGQGGSLGGPISRDHIWFYASVNLPNESLLDRRNNLGVVPDREEETDEYSASSRPTRCRTISWRLRPARGRPRPRTTASAPPPIRRRPPKTRRTTCWAPSPGSGTSRANSLAELKLNHNKEENSGVPITDLGYRPAFNAARPDLVGLFSTTADRIIGGATAAGQAVGGASLFNFQDFKRDEARLSYQQFATLGSSRHDLRAGVTYDKNEERLDRRANGWGSITWSATTQRVHGDLQLHPAAAHRPRRDLGRLPPGPDGRSANG